MTETPSATAAVLVLGAGIMAVWGIRAWQWVHGTNEAVARAR